MSGTQKEVLQALRLQSQTIALNMLERNHVVTGRSRDEEMACKQRDGSGETNQSKEPFQRETKLSYDILSVQL